LSEVLWFGEIEGRDFSTPERRAGLEADLAAIVKQIRDAKIADYYARDFSERVFNAFRHKAAASRRDSGAERRPLAQKPDYRARNERGIRGAAQRPPLEAVSPAVRRSLHAVNAKGAARIGKERELLGFLLAGPSLIEREAEILAKISFTVPLLDRLKGELLNLASSGVRLERTIVENHLLRQGLGSLAEQLRSQPAVRHIVEEMGDTGLGEAWRRTVAQLDDPDFGVHGELKSQRDEALKRYLDGGADKDWDEVQRLNGLIRAQVGSQ
jgi:DNA primase